MSEGTGRRNLSLVGTKEATSFRTTAFLAITLFFDLGVTFFFFRELVTFAFLGVAISAPLSGFI